MVETWLEEKIIDNSRDKLTVKLGIDTIRINFYDKYYYVPKTQDSIKAFNEENVEFFVERVNSIQKAKPNRKTRRANTKFYNKMMNKIKSQSKKNAKNISNEISEKISEHMINNPDATLEDIKLETKDNLANVLVEEKEHKNVEENNG